MGSASEILWVQFRCPGQGGGSLTKIANAGEELSEMMPGFRVLRDHLQDMPKTLDPLTKCASLDIKFRLLDQCFGIV